MGSVRIIFYWGGNIIKDRVEGVRYDIEAKGFYNVPRVTTLDDLEALLLPKVIPYGGNYRLKFKYRCFLRQVREFTKYTTMPVHDNDTLETILAMAAGNPDSCLEFYVDVEEGPIEPQTYVHGPGPYEHQLTQTTDVGGSHHGAYLGGYTPVPYTEHDMAYPFESVSTSFTNVVRPVARVADREQSSSFMDTLPYEGAAIGQDTSIDAIERFISYTASLDEIDLNVDSRGAASDSDEDVDALLTSSEQDAVAEDGDEDYVHQTEGPSEGLEAAGTSDPTNVPRIVVEVPFYGNIDMDNDGSTTSRDFYTRNRLWNEETAELRRGMLFKDKTNVIKAVKLHHIKNNREYTVVDSRTNVWVVKCNNDCSWYLRAAKKRSHELFEITQYAGDHHCVYARMNRDHRNLDSNFIASSMTADVARNPDIALATIITTVNSLHKYQISYKKAWLARTKAVEMVYGKFDESYARLPKYMYALQLYNPGTVVDWDLVYPSSTDNVAALNYVFWAFKPSIDGFKHCPPVICIDGTHLYGKYKGKMLIATGVTADRKMFPLAFSVVDEENTPSWSWFIINLRRHIALDREGVTLNQLGIALPHFGIALPHCNTTLSEPAPYDYLLLSIGGTEHWSSDIISKVYLLHKGVWKEGGHINLGARDITFDSLAYCHGTLHFLSSWFPCYARGSRFYWPYVVAYNLETKASRFLKVPKNARRGLADPSCKMGVFDWKERSTICLVKLLKGVFTIWILSDYVSERWYKVLQVRARAMGMVEHNPTVAGFTLLSGHSLLVATDKRVYRYELLDDWRARRAKRICRHWCGDNVLLHSYYSTLRSCGDRSSSFPI